jgi:hypothetical protein
VVAASTPVARRHKSQVDSGSERAYGCLRHVQSIEFLTSV